MSTNTAYCPECDEPVRVRGKATLGQQVTCPNCGTQLEVISLEPLELDWAYEDLEEEDEEYEFDDYEDDEDY